MDKWTIFNFVRVVASGGVAKVSDLTVGGRGSQNAVGIKLWII